MAMKNGNKSTVLTGQCYCGKIKFSSSEGPQTVAYCHCDSCRRATGGPVAAFAALDEKAVSFFPNEGRTVSVNTGVIRTFCGECGSSLTGRYDYLPGQIYISLGIIDQANELTPKIHCHESERLTWLHIDDDLEPWTSTARSKIIDMPNS